MLYKKIKEAVNSFNDAAFVSLYGEDKVIVKNPSNDGEYLISYSEENGKVILHTENSKIITEPKESNYKIGQGYVEKMKDSVRGVFEDEDGIDYLRETISEMPANDEIYFKEDVTEREGDEEIINNSIVVCESDAEFVNNINKGLEKSIMAYRESFINLFESGYLFDTEGDIKEGEMIAPKDIFESMDKKTQITNAFFESMDRFDIFVESVKEQIDDEEVVNYVLENTDFTKSDVTTQFTKAITKAKRFENKDIVIPETLKAFNESYREIFGKEAEGAYMETVGNLTAPNDTDINKLPSSPQYKFLDPKNTKFSFEDVKQITKEIQKAMNQHYGNFTEESLSIINEGLHTMEYMLRTRQINDDVIARTISDLNNSFKSQPNDYNDPEKSLGFRSDSEVTSRVVI